MGRGSVGFGGLGLVVARTTALVPATSSSSSCPRRTRRGGRVAGRIQDWLIGHRLPTRDGTLAVGVSIGVGSLGGGDPSIGTMVERADAAKHEEKRTGSRSFLAVA